MVDNSLEALESVFNTVPATAALVFRVKTLLGPEHTSWMQGATSPWSPLMKIIGIIIESLHMIRRAGHCQ